MIFTNPYIPLHIYRDLINEGDVIWSGFSGDPLMGSHTLNNHQIDNNRVLSGERTFELVNFDWEKPYLIIHLKRDDGALVIPKGTFHRSVSGLTGSVVNKSSH